MGRGTWYHVLLDSQDLLVFQTSTLTFRVGVLTIFVSSTTADVRLKLTIRDHKPTTPALETPAHEPLRRYSTVP
jgi:hypothetical protein